MSIGEAILAVIGIAAAVVFYWIARDWWRMGK